MLIFFSRFNINRPNRLLARGRSPALNNLKPAAQAAAAAVTPVESDSADVADKETASTNSDSEDTETSTPQTGLNKIKQRPRIQISAATAVKSKAPIVALNRKVNPLISRRKLGATSTTAG